MAYKEDKYVGESKKLIAIKGKGTPREQRIDTGVILYWSPALRRYVSIPSN